MKKHLIFFLSLSFLASIIDAQPVITETKLFYPSGTSIVKIIETGNPTYTYGNCQIGKELSGSTQMIYRTYYTIDLSTIPLNATIQKVNLNYSTNYKSYTFKLTNISSLGSILSANWTAIGGGNTLHSGIGYGNGIITSTPIKNQMQSALSSRSMIIGALGENESANDSYSYLSLDLEVVYTRPAASLNFIAENYLDGSNVGNIGVGVNTSTITSRQSPFIFSIYEDQHIYLQAYDNQHYYDYNWVFNDIEAPDNQSHWERDLSGQILLLGNSQLLSRAAYSSENGSTIRDYLKKLCQLTFQANSSMTIKGNYRISPFTESVVEQNSISALASSYSTDGIDYTFSKWSTGSGDVYSPITASEHEYHTAVYTGKPNNNYRNLSFNTSQEGQPVQLTWSMHPLDNSSISHYAVYRKVTSSGTPTLLTTVSATGSSSYSYTDYEFAISNSQNKILLFYDVRPYYTPDAAYSDAAFEGVYGFYYSNKLPEEIAQNQTIQTIPETFEVNNYPNPFNPSTTINYQLPENGFVTLKVFDILGKEIETLVNENKSAGYYKVNFDGSNLASGVYIYTIRVNEIMQSKKMLLAK